MNGRDCVIRWGVRDTLIRYLERADDFTVELGGGAEFADGVVTLPARREDDGSVVATGWARLRAHGGALAVDLVDARLEGEALTILDPLEDPDSAPARMRLVTLAPGVDAADWDTPGGPEFATALAAEADVLFLYNYLPGAAFAPLRVVPAGADSIIARS